ncbi:MAG: hypothetical protein LBF90_01545 [Prevotellaceae bacterium]|jgi:hypothetical protein|nr:hypothetical protein [Prevotellaceae bacterium]
MKRFFKQHTHLFIAKKVPSTQKYYHVVYDANGKLVKECNIYSYVIGEGEEGVLKLMTPEALIRSFSWIQGKKSSANIPRTMPVMISSRMTGEKYDY